MTNILVADDDKLIRWSLKEILSKEGYDVHTVASSLEAIQQAEKTVYSLIIVDFEIDEGDVIHMIRKMKSRQMDAKVIIISALSRQKIESQLAGLDIFSVIEKPFHTEDIIATAKRAIG